MKKTLSHYYFAICLTALLTIEPISIKAMIWYFPTILTNMAFATFLLNKYDEITE